MYRYRTDLTYKIDMKLRHTPERKSKPRPAELLGMAERDSSEERFDPFRHGQLEEYKRLFMTEFNEQKRTGRYDPFFWANDLVPTLVDTSWVEQLRKNAVVKVGVVTFAQTELATESVSDLSNDHFQLLAKLAQIFPEVRIDPEISPRVRKYYDGNVDRWIHFLGERGPKAERVCLPNLAAAMQLVPDQQSRITQRFLTKGKDRVLFLVNTYLPQEPIKSLLVAAKALLINPDMRAEIQERLEPYWPEIRKEIREKKTTASFLAGSIVGAKQVQVDHKGELHFDFSRTEVLKASSPLPERPHV